jgi:hypothetical protein
MARKEMTRTSEGFRTVWRWAEDKGEGIEVDVYEAYMAEEGDDLGDPIMEWNYPKVPGFNSLAALSMFWLDQAILQAKGELEKADAKA